MSSRFDRSGGCGGSAAFRLLFDALISEYLFASLRNLSASDSELALSRSNSDFLPKCRGEEVKDEGSFMDSVAETEVSTSAFGVAAAEGTFAWKFSGGKCWFCI